MSHSSIACRLRLASTALALALCASMAACNDSGRYGARDADADGILDASDCAPNDGTRWQLLPYVSADADFDSFRVNEAGEACSGDTLAAGYFTEPGPETITDCDDTDATSWRRSMIYVDADNDGVGAGAAVPGCIGTTPATGFALGGYDPVDDPSDPDATSVSNFDMQSGLLITPL